MDEEDVRERSQALCDALVAGDVDRATADFSAELRHNLGEVIALLPLPSSEASIVSVDHSGAGYNVVIRLVGDAEEVMIETRWKERDDRPTIVEVSHLSRTAIEAQSAEGETPADVETTDARPSA